MGNNILIFFNTFTKIRTVRHVFRNEQRYYELLVDKSITSLCLFPYHLADIITKGLRVTPFNYYVDVLSYLLKNDRSYDTLPNFTAADCKNGDCLKISFSHINELNSLKNNDKRRACHNKQRSLHNLIFQAFASLESDEMNI